jgi:hypothetical protein
MKGHKERVYARKLLCVLPRNAFGGARKAGSMTSATDIGAAARVQQLLSEIAESILPDVRARSASERERTMRALVLTTALLMACSTAYADSCKMEAGSKKLAGAAMTSFMKKCETDAKATCAKSAAEKKLAGAAKDSFTKKCVTDAIGS